MFGLRVTPTLFLSTPSARRATSCANRKRPTSADFYPRPPRGGRPAVMQCQPSPLEFLSTPSARRATRRGRPGYARRRISIHALREEGDFGSLTTCKQQCIFLSTPSARRATLPFALVFFWRIISIHALREEGDLREPPPQAAPSQFLSTPSARRATELRGIDEAVKSNFYPRPPRGGRPGDRVKREGHCSISIHALREEGDQMVLPRYLSQESYFYPRPPRGGRQQKQRQNLYFQTNYTTFCTNLEEP